MTLPLIKDSNSVNLDGTEYRTIGWVSRQEVNRYAGKVVTGDTSRESRPHLSALALTDWRGGMGVDRYHGRGEVDRTFFGNLDTRFEGHMTLSSKGEDFACRSSNGRHNGHGSP